MINKNADGSFRVEPCGCENNITVYDVRFCAGKMCSPEKITVEFNIPLENNVGNYYYPDIEFNVTGNSFTIENKTTNETMSFTGLDSSCQKGIIYGDGMMTMVSLSNNKVNLRQKSNRKFIRLQNGNNTIKITGNGTFTIKVQPKISLR